MLFSPCSIRSYLFEKRTLLYASSDPSCKGLGHWRSSVRKARWWAGSVLGSGSYLAGNILILSVLCFALLLLLFSFFFIFFCILLSGSFRKMLSKSPTRCWMGYSTEPLSSHLSPRWRVQQRQRWRLLILRSLSLYIYVFFESTEQLPAQWNQEERRRRKNLVEVVGCLWIGFPPTTIEGGGRRNEAPFDDRQAWRITMKTEK